MEYRYKQFTYGKKPTANNPGMNTLSSSDMHKRKKRITFNDSRMKRKGGILNESGMILHHYSKPLSSEKSSPRSKGSFGNITKNQLLIQSNYIQG